MTSSSAAFHVIPVRLLSSEMKDTLFSHLSSDPKFQPSTAQYNYGDQVSIEMYLPSTLVNRLKQTDVGQYVTPSHTATRVSFVDHSLQAEASSYRLPSVLVQNSGARSSFGASPPQPAPLPPPSSPLPQQPLSSHTNRSCQWLHKMIDEVYQFRQKQFQLELLSLLQPANSYFCGSEKDKRNVVAATKPVATSDDLSSAVFRLLSKTFGVPGLVRKHAEELLNATRAYREMDLDVQLFGILLMSQAYDTEAVRKVLQWRGTLLPFTIQKQERTSMAIEAVVTRRFVKVREVPGLLRKCLVDVQERSAWATDAVSALQDEIIWHRVRAALPSWCDPCGRFPATVPDPNFYTPPFRHTNPYVGHIPSPTADRDTATIRQMLLAHEGRFREFSSVQVVHLGQLLMLLLLCWKEEQLHPTSPTHPVLAGAARVSEKSPVRTTTPARRPKPYQRAASPSGTHVDPQALGRKTTPLRNVAQGSRPEQRPQEDQPRRHRSAMNTATSSANPSPPQQSSPPSSPARNRTTTQAGQLIDISPSVFPYGSPSVVQGGGNSPSLRDEEDQFHKDVVALEKRLAKTVQAAYRSRMVV